MAHCTEGCGLASAYPYPGVITLGTRLAAETLVLSMGLDFPVPVHNGNAYDHTIRVMYAKHDGHTYIVPCRTNMPLYSSLTLV